MLTNIMHPANEFLKTKNELQKQSEWLQITLSSIGEGVIVTDGLNQVTFLNRAAEDLTGWSASEAVGSALANVFPMVDEQTGLPIVKQTDRSRERNSGLPAETVLLIARNGSLRAVEESTSPLHGPAGEIIGSVLIFRDVTKRKQAETLLRQSEAQHRFLENLGQLLQSLTCSQEIMALTAKRLADYLGASRCAYAKVEDASGEDPILVVTRDHGQDAPSFVGRWSIKELGNDCQSKLLANAPFVIDDVQTNRRIGPSHLPFYRAAAIGAVICVPLHQNGKLVACMAVHQTKPRRWTTAEVQLVTTVVHRSWDALERVRIASSLKESEERLRNLADNLPSGFIYQIQNDKTGSRRFTYISRGVETLCGLTQAEVLTEPARLFRLIAPEDLPLVKSMERSSRQDGVRFDCQFRVHLGAQVRWFHCRSAPKRSSDGGQIWDGVALDITEQREAEDAFKESEMRLRRLAAAGIIGLIRWDLDQSLILDANDEFLRMTGYDHADLAEGRLNFRSMTPPEWTSRNEAGIDALRTTGVGGAYEKEYFRKDGSRVPVIIVGVRFADTPNEGMSFVLDITERKQAEDALARLTFESERRRRLYETILSSTPDLVCVFGLNRRFTYANEALLLLLGKTWEEVIGKTLLELGYEPWHAAMHDREIEQVISTKSAIRGEVPFTGTQGPRIYDYIFVPVIGANGEVEAVGGTNRDITERKQAEEELKAADRKKNEFLALLAHELRNPLAPLRNGVQILKLAKDDSQASAEARQMMERQLGHMVRLIDDLLDISRISQHKMELRRTRIPLQDVVSSAVETVRPAIQAGAHQLSISLTPEPIDLDADLTRLAQVFSNLLSNSAKYTPRGGAISLSARRQDGDVVVCVQDNGIGIPSESLPRIFDMFSQVDRSIERTTGGLGIGLALVRALTEMHGGSVEAASAGEGKGSTFTVRLPILARANDPDSASLQSEDRAKESSLRRILVVDDNRDSANSMATMLKLRGNEVRVAHDGLEAMRTAEAFRPQAILMDVGMPKCNGYDATRHIRREAWGRDMIIIALTGWGQEIDRLQSKQAGCDGHLVKPIHLSNLERLLGELSEARNRPADRAKPAP